MVMVEGEVNVVDLGVQMDVSGRVHGFEVLQQA